MEHEMHDLGEMIGGEQPTVAGEGKKEKYYPSINLTTEQMPALENKKIGGEVSLHIKGLIKGIRKDKEKTSYDIELKECGMMGKMSKDEYDKMSDEEKDKADEKEVLDEKE